MVSLFTLCVTSLLALILIGRGLQLRELFMGLEIDLTDILQLFFYLGPFFLLLIVPIACMLAVFMTFLRMSTDRELVALKAGGLSLYQLLPSPVVFCIGCTLLNLFISLFGLSWGMHNFRATIVDIAQTRARIVMQPGVFNQDIPGITVFAKRVDNDSGALGDVMIEDSTRDKAKIVIIAPSGQIASDREAGEILFRLQNGKIYRQQKDNVSVLGFEEYSVRLNLSRLLRGLDIGELKPKEMSWGELRKLRLNPGERAHDDNYRRKVVVEQHKRFALPLACLVLGLFAMPLACAFEGVQRQVGIVLALVNFLFYYTLLSIGLTTGESGTIPPAIGLWIPNAVFSVLAIVGLHRTSREQSMNIIENIKHIRLFKRKKAES